MKHKFKKAGSLIYQILILLVLFTAAFLLLARANLIQLPGFIQNIFDTEQEITSVYNGDNQEIFEFIHNVPESSEKFKEYPEITVDNMNTLLNSLTPHKNFYWESVSETYSLDSVVTKNCKSRISGDKYNVEIFDNNGNISTKYISDGKVTHITKYMGTNTNSKSYTSGIFDFYSDAGLVSVDHFKDADFISGNCEIRLVENEQYKLVSIVYTYDRNGVTVKNDYGISLDFGVVLFAKCYENDIPVFKQTTKSIYPLTSLDDKLFTVN